METEERAGAELQILSLQKTTHGSLGPGVREVYIYIGVGSATVKGKE